MCSTPCEGGNVLADVHGCPTRLAIGQRQGGAVVVGVALDAVMVVPTPCDDDGGVGGGNGRILVADGHRVDPTRLGRRSPTMVRNPLLLLPGWCFPLGTRGLRYRCC